LNTNVKKSSDCAGQTPYLCFQIWLVD